MKKLLCMLTTLILCLFMMTASAASPDSNSIAWLSKFNGVWYDANGQPGIKIDISTRNFAGMKVILADRLSGGGQLYSFRAILDDKGQVKAKRIEYNGEGATKYLGFNGKTYRTTPRVPYYESIGGIHLHMSRQQVEAVWGVPSSEKIIKELHNQSRVTYASKGAEVWYSNDDATHIVLQKDSSLRFDRSGLGVNNSVQKFVRVYNIKQPPLYDISFNIGHDNEHIVLLEEGGIIFCPYST